MCDQRLPFYDYADIYLVFDANPMVQGEPPCFIAAFRYLNLCYAHALKDDECNCLYFALFIDENGSFKITNITDNIRPCKTNLINLRKKGI